MNYQVHFAKLQPKALAHALQLSPAMQRDWRRHGFIPPRSQGWSNYSLMEVGAIAIRKALVDAHLGPAFSNDLLDSDVGRRSITSIVWWAVEDNGFTCEPVERSRRHQELRVDIKHRADHDRFALVDEIVGHSIADLGTVLTIVPEVEFSRLDLEPPGLDALPGVSVSIVVHLRNIGQRLRQSIGGHLAVLSPRAP